MTPSRPTKAPLAIKRMWRVEIVSGIPGVLPRAALMADWSWPVTSFGDSTGTSPSSMILRRLVWTPRPETSRPPPSVDPASLSTSSR